jgi:hypothetical protein
MAPLLLIAALCLVAGGAAVLDRDIEHYADDNHRR